jgi:hypothetical protein
MEDDMPLAVSYPGVYVNEEPSGARAIAGVGTSITALLGMARKGPMFAPKFIGSFADFERNFGAETDGELADQVFQFFVNGGTQAYVVRIANNAIAADVVLRTEEAAPRDALRLTARDAGLEGNLIRAEVDYDTASPERTFNLTLYRSRLQPDGTYSREEEESFSGLSMDPGSAFFVPTIVDGSSNLVTATALAAPAGLGLSMSGIVFPTNATTALDIVNALISGGANRLRVGVDNLPAVEVTVATGNNDITQPDNVGAQIAAAVNGMYAGQATITFNSDSGAANAVTGGRLMWFESASGPVVITPASGADLSVPMMLGTGAGGVEVDPSSAARPAPTSASARPGVNSNQLEALRDLISQPRNNIQSFTLVDGAGANVTAPTGLANDATRLYEGPTVVPAGAIGSLTNIRSDLETLANAISAGTDWAASRQGWRLVLSTDQGGPDGDLALRLTSSGAGAYNIGSAANPFDDGAPAPNLNAYNVTAYSVGQIAGSGGAGGFQDGAGATPGDDGAAPLIADYNTAFDRMRREVPLFNLMVLPRALGQNDDARAAIWGSASAFCAAQRAFLLVDPRSDWGDIDAAVGGIDGLRIGVDTRNSATFWPRLRVSLTGSTSGRPIDPSGSIAGLMARTDARFGVWRAGAGVNSSVLGVIGIEHPMSDLDNGRINPKALNAIRVFPSGVVSWGARTLVGFDGSGNIDDKYIPVRRTMLFIEESLYRGLKFAVFMPNDEDLWSQIRLAAGSFMSGLFRQGAFAGTKESDAFFVLCDSTTTTPNDINLGIVNVTVGFAPLKPAEFVVLTVKQIAGQASA